MRTTAADDDGDSTGDMMAAVEATSDSEDDMLPELVDTDDSSYDKSNAITECNNNSISTGDVRRTNEAAFDTNYCAQLPEVVDSPEDVIVPDLVDDIGADGAEN